jgi:hypothetical protein
MPDVPEGCQFFSNKVMNRDFFMCNPTNTGHYQYPKFETYSYDDGCHEKEVRNFLAKSDPEKYVVFYTRYNQENKVIGYFRVGEKYSEGGKIGFHSCESLLLDKQDCIPIPYKSRGVPVSWGNSSIRLIINDLLVTMKSGIMTDISADYQMETEKIMELMNSSSGKSKAVSICEKCHVKSDCYWGRTKTDLKINRLNKLYGAKEKC